MARLLEWVEWIGLLGVVDSCVPFWILWRQRCDGVSVEMLAPANPFEVTSVDSLGEGGLGRVL